MSKVPASNSVPNEKSIKRAAKELSRSNGISYCKALDQIAKNHKFLDYHHFQKAHSGFFGQETTVFWFTIDFKFAEEYFIKPYEFIAAGISEDQVFHQFVLKDLYTLISKLPPETGKNILTSTYHDGEITVAEKVSEEIDLGWTKCFRCMLEGKLTLKEMQDYVGKYFHLPDDLFYDNKVYSFGLVSTNGKSPKQLIEPYKDWAKDFALQLLPEDEDIDQ